MFHATALGYPGADLLVSAPWAAAQAGDPQAELLRQDFASASSPSKLIGSQTSPR